MDFLLASPLFIPIGVAFIGLVAVIVLITRLMRLPAGSSSLQAVARSIQEGASAYLHRYYAITTLFSLLIFAGLAFLLPGMGWHLAVGFLLGAFLSAVTGYIGMSVAIRANARTAAAAKGGLAAAFGVAFRGGAVTGLLVPSLVLGGIAGFYYYLTAFLGLAVLPAAEALAGFGLGASFLALFARLGGGIFAKAADLSVELVAETERGLSAEDPKNPATIADNVGDNVGDLIGSATDLFETYTLTTIATMVLAAFALGGPSEFNELQIILPLFIGAIALVATLLGLLVVRGQHPMRALYQGVFLAGLLSVLGTYLLITQLGLPLPLFYASAVGYGITLLLMLATEYYTSDAYSPVHSVAESATLGSGMLVLTGVSAGLRSVALPVLIVAGGFFSAYQLADFYGIALAALSLLSLTGMVVSLSAFGPIADNAAGLLAMSDPSSHAAKHLQRLDAVGNTVKAITKGYSSSAASLTAIVLFHTFIVVLFAHAPASDLVFSLTEPLVLAGVLAGAFVPFFFASQCLTAVTRTARRAAEEIRRLLHAKSSTAKVSHGSFTTWLTSASLRAMFAPALFALVLPVVVSFYLGMPLFVGFFAAVLVVGFVLSLVLVNTGNAWDNAKKHIEDDHHGGKGSLAYQAASVGDFIGDPYKDTAGPALSSLIKLTSIIALLAATLAA